MKELRPYQADTVEAVFKELNTGIKWQLVCYATGMGKTLTAAHIINKFPGRCLWITHTEELIEQSVVAIMKEEDFWNEQLERDITTDGLLNWKRQSQGLFNKNEAHNFIGIIKQDLMQLDHKVVVASIQTLWRRLEKIPADWFDVIVIDEAHMAMANTWNKTINHFTPKLGLGLTATPKRLDGLSLGNIFDKIVVEKDIKFGIDNGYLCELDAIGIRTQLSLDKVRTTAGEFNEKDLAELVDRPERNALIVESYNKYAAGRQALVFCVTIQHAINVATAFQNAGINSSFVVSDEKLCPNRKERISLFKTGEIQVMTNVGILTAGFDHPEVSCIIMARPTKSLVLYLQSIGRGTRLKKNWKDCLILDVVDVSSRHQLVNAWELDKEKPIEERTFVSKQKKLKLIEGREAKFVAKSKSDKRVNLFKIPKVKIITSEKMKEPATEGQLKWISDLGYDTVTNEYTKAMCADIISNSAASDKHKAWLKFEGYDVPESLTIGQYQAAKNEIEDRKRQPVLSHVPANLPFKDLA